MQYKRRGRVDYPILDLPLYRLDGTTFTSVDAYHRLCTVTGATWGIQGRSFTTDDYINCGIAGLNPLTALGIGAWFKVTGGAGTDRGIVYRWDTAGGVNERTYGLTIDNTDKLNFKTSRDGTDATSVAVTSLATVSLNVWHYGFGYWDGTNNGVVLDGVLQNTAAQASIRTSPNTQTAIGAVNGRVGDPVSAYYEGVIGEVAIYSRAPSIAGIQNKLLSTKGRYQ